MSPKQDPQARVDAAIVIMAGGSGERFWPVSNAERPKQLLRIFGDRTLLEMSFERAASFVGSRHVYLVAGDSLRDAILENLPDLPEANYIAEPRACNTAACLGLAACHLAVAEGPKTAMGVLTADHLIEAGPEFDRCVLAALEHATRSGDLVTIGMQPRRADTGYGYVRVGEKIDDVETSAGALSVFRAAGFEEKPDAATAERFVAGGEHLWNSGMFFWRVDAFLDEFDRFQPEMAEQWTKLRSLGQVPLDRGAVREAFDILSSHRLAVDKAIMEVSEHIALVKGEFGWEDVGSWDALARVLPRDEKGNVAVGKARLVDSIDNIIYNDSGSTACAPEIVLFGVRDLVIVRTDGNILVMPTSKAQEVKGLLDRLKDPASQRP